MSLRGVPFTSGVGMVDIMNLTVLTITITAIGANPHRKSDATEGNLPLDKNA